MPISEILAPPNRRPCMAAAPAADRPWSSSLASGAVPPVPRREQRSAYPQQVNASPLTMGIGGYVCALRKRCAGLITMDT